MQLPLKLSHKVCVFLGFFVNQKYIFKLRNYMSIAVCEMCIKVKVFKIAKLIKSEPGNDKGQEVT